MGGLHRLRIEVRSGSGALAKAGVAIGDLGGTISSVDLLTVDDGISIVDAVVNLPSEHSAPEVVSEALQSRQAGILRSWRPVDEVIDPVLRTIRWASSIVSAHEGAGDDEVTRVIAEIVGTADTWLLPIEEALAHEVAQRAMERGTPVSDVVTEVPDNLSASFCGASWVLAVPNSRLEPDRIAIVLRPVELPFTTTEIDRIEAVLALRRRSSALMSHYSPNGLAEGPWLNLSVRSGSAASTEAHVKIP